jgi:hypothetical protein
MKPRSRAPGPLSVAAERQEKPSSLGEAATSVRFSWSGSAGRIRWLLSVAAERHAKLSSWGEAAARIRFSCGATSYGVAS